MVIIYDQRDFPIVVSCHYTNSILIYYTHNTSSGGSISHRPYYYSIMLGTYSDH